MKSYGILSLLFPFAKVETEFHSHILGELDALRTETSIMQHF